MKVAVLVGQAVREVKRMASQNPEVWWSMGSGSYYYPCCAEYWRFVSSHSLSLHCDSPGTSTQGILDILGGGGAGFFKTQ